MLTLTQALQEESWLRHRDVPFTDCLRYARILDLFGMDPAVVEEFRREFNVPDRVPPSPFPSVSILPNP